MGKTLSIGITGGNGVLGKILQTQLRNKAFYINCYNGDINSPDDLHTWVQSLMPDYMFHLAAIVPTIEVNKNPLSAYKTNVGGTISLLEQLVKLNKPVWLFVASSSHVYKSSDRPIRETDALDPITIYGKTKLLAEQVCMDCMEKYNLKICIGRIFSYYHQTQKEPFLYPTILKRLKEHKPGSPFYLQGADSIRDFLTGEDVADIMIKLLLSQAAGIYNIASGTGIRIRDFVQKLYPEPLNIVPCGIPNFLVANVDKIRREIYKI